MNGCLGGGRMSVRQSHSFQMEVTSLGEHLSLAWLIIKEMKILFLRLWKSDKEFDVSVSYTNKDVNDKLHFHCYKFIKCSKTFLQFSL